MEKRDLKISVSHQNTKYRRQNQELKKYKLEKYKNLKTSGAEVKLAVMQNTKLGQNTRYKIKTK